MYPVAYGHSRRELTPVRLCSVRLSWRQRARPSTTLHEIQICRSRLEYIVCITADGGPQLADRGGAEVVSTKWMRRIGNGESKCGWGKDADEDLLEVCCQFLDERFFGDGVDGNSTDCANRKGEEEEQELNYKHCASAAAVVCNQAFGIRQSGGRCRARPGRRRRG